MRRFFSPVLILTAFCLSLAAAVPATAQDTGKSCKTLRRAIVWSIDAKHGYMVLIDELERQYVVNCDDVRRRGAASQKPSRIQVGDAVSVKCHALR